MSASSSSSSAPARILLVDDNDHGLVARKTVLEEHGYQVEIAKAAHQAVKVFGNRHFDIVITDYRMPEMNGLELITKIRGIRESVPIILISSVVGVFGLNEANTGADAVIPKDAHEVTTLPRCVSRLLRKAKKKPPGSHRPAARKRKKDTG
jgi:two-component system, NtrC family, response regulator HydG